MDRHGVEGFEPVLGFVRRSQEEASSDLLVESKYIRNSTSPSVASEGIAADLTKYPDGCHILFFVYDPDRAISDDEAYKADFEGKGRCTVCVVR